MSFLYTGRYSTSLSDNSNVSGGIQHRPYTGSCNFMAIDK